MILQPDDIQGAVDRLRNEPIELLSDAAYLEHTLLPELGLNNEITHEFPQHLAPYMGQGVRSWQYPAQFSKYLVWLSDKQIQSYLEIGCRHGGTFIITVEYLSRFTPIQQAVAVDLGCGVNVQTYAGINRAITHYDLNSRSEAFASLVKSRQYDLVLIDGDHSWDGVKNDFETVKDNATYAVFHDIHSDACPDVGRFWRSLPDTSFDPVAEFIDQYEEVQQRTSHKYLGIGIGKKK